MASTPEGKVKQKVRSILDRYPAMYYYMPVPTGYGKTSLDFIGSYNRLAFAIETKAEGGVPTQRQYETMEDIRASGAPVFVITGLDDREYGPLILWLESNRPTSHDHSHQPQASRRNRII